MFHALWYRLWVILLYDRAAGTTPLCVNQFLVTGVYKIELNFVYFSPSEVYYCQLIQVVSLYSGIIEKRFALSGRTSIETCMLLGRTLIFKEDTVLNQLSNRGVKVSDMSKSMVQDKRQPTRQ